MSVQPGVWISASPVSQQSPAGGFVSKGNITLLIGWGGFLKRMDITEAINQVKV